MIKGPTGCSKSRFVEHMAWKLDRPLIAVACNEDMTASDLVGRYLLDANGTRWLNGPLTIEARIGSICYLDEIVEARLAAMDAVFSTRMGGAIRHASHYLEAQKADKKLMLILTDGESADIDVDDEQYLISDTKRTVDEISSKEMYSYCISLDKKADDFIQDIFRPGGYTL